MAKFDKTHASIIGMADQLQTLQSSMVLIDDCESFCGLMHALSPEFNIKLTTYYSLADMYSFAKLREFDLALIDYHLESWSGVEIASYIDVFFPDLPVVLISADALELDKSWPICIKGVLTKSLGMRTLLKKSLEILFRQRFYRLLEDVAFGNSGAGKSIRQNPDGQH